MTILMESYLILLIKESHLFFFFLRLAVEGTNGIDNHVPTSTVVQNSCRSYVVNGDDTPSSPTQVAARPKNTPAPKPLTSEPANDTGKHGDL